MLFCSVGTCDKDGEKEECCGVNTLLTQTYPFSISCQEDGGGRVILVREEEMGRREWWGGCLCRRGDGSPRLALPCLAVEAVQEAPTTPSTPHGASAPDNKTGSNDARLRISV